MVPPVLVTIAASPSSMACTGAKRLVLGPGDTVVLPAGAERQVSARTDAQLIVCGRGDAVVRVPGEAAPRGTHPGSGDALANAPEQVATVSVNAAEPDIQKATASLRLQELTNWRI